MKIMIDPKNLELINMIVNQRLHRLRSTGQKGQWVNMHKKLQAELSKTETYVIVDLSEEAFILLLAILNDIIDTATNIMTLQSNYFDWIKYEYEGVD